VCFRHRGGDAVNRRLMDRLNASGKLYLTHTKLDGRFVLRMAIGGTLTEDRHVAQAWKLICEAGERETSSG
jgi:aromatic-L-amino-acid decarboxylase